MTDDPAKHPDGDTDPMPQKKSVIIRGEDIPTEAVILASTQLLGRVDPTLPAQAMSAVMPQLENFYVPEVLGSIDKSLAAVVTTGGGLYVQGEVLGVGVSTLLTDYGNSIRQAAHRSGHPWHVLYVRVAVGTKSIPKFLDELGTSIGCKITTSDLQNRSYGTLGKRIVESARRQRICMIIIDHAENLDVKVRPVLGDLMMAIDPRYQVALETPENLGKIGIVVASHVPAKSLFRTNPDILPRFDLGFERLGRYETVEAVAEALRRVDIGLEDLDLKDTADALLVDAILDLSGGGIVAQMRPLIAFTAMICETNGAKRPTAQHAYAAVEFYNRGAANITKVSEAKAATVAKPEPTPKKPKKKTRSEVLKEKKETQGMAKAEQAHIRRRRGKHNVLP